MSDVATLVACGGSKRENRQPVWKLYESVPFEKSWTAAMLVGDPFVISAKHGLVPPTERLDPYDETLKNKSREEKREWATDVVAALPVHYDEVVVFGGRDYVNPLKWVCEELDVTVHDPYEDTVGNGQQSSIAGKMSAAVLDGNEPLAVVE